MQILDHIRESQTFLSRAIIAGLLLTLALILLVSRLFQLQVLDHEHFTTLSTDNRVKVLPKPPTRGLIYDRNGKLLAQNRPAHSLEITPEQVRNLDQTLLELGKIIEISDNDLSRFHRLKRRKRRFDSIPIRSNLGPEETARFAVERHRFPGVDIKAQLLRHYPYQDKTAHILGYVGRISQRDLGYIDESNYAGTSHIGKIGIEKTYESTLHGEVGLQQVEVNAVGRMIRTLSETPPRPGVDLHLHIDIDLQAVAMQAFAEHNGAAVVIDPNSGGILAMVSNPGYNPNLFVEGISSINYNGLQKNPRRPLYNRALRGQYPPGSTVKPFIGLAGLETRTISYDSSNYCGGYYQLPNSSHKYRDWKKSGHGPVDLDVAITQSCDVFFYKLAHDMGVNQLHEYLQQFRFGERTGIDMVGESTGLLPSREWKKRARRLPWYPGETVIMGIGQGYFLTTPLQLAAATAAIANNGTYHTPRIVDYIQTRNQDDQTPITDPSSQIAKIDEHNWEDVRAAMTHVTEGLRGTAKRIRNDNYRIAGKTGTAQVFTVKQDEEYEEDKISHKNRDHALFVAYAPVEDPQIAIAVIVENGGHGGSIAAPIAKKIMDAWLLPNEVKQDES